MRALVTRLYLWLRPVQPDVTSPEEKRRIEAREADDRARLRMLRLEADLLARRIRERD